MRRVSLLAFVLIVVVCLASCDETAVSPSATSLPTLAPTATIPTPTLTIHNASVAGAEASGPENAAVAANEAISTTKTPQPSATPPPTNPPIIESTSSPIPQPTADPYSNYTIEALASRTYGGGLVEIVDTLEENDSFTRYLIRYPSDGLTIYGFMNVPAEGNNFPAVLLLHGYIDPDAYETVAYTRRYADNLAEAGYFVFHPNFRNYPPSDSGDNAFRVGYAIDVLNLIAIIREQSKDPAGTLRRVDEDNLHLWGHSMGGGVALRVVTINNDGYLKAAVLYGSMSGDERQNYEKILEWSGGQTGPFELAASAETLTAVSPSHHLERINAAISVHHSRADDVVPVAWSEALCEQLATYEPPANCFFYDGQPHTFRGEAENQFMERVITFFRQH